MKTYSDWVATKYTSLLATGEVSDIYAQPIIRLQDVTRQMALHNASEHHNVVMLMLTDHMTPSYSRNEMRELFREAFYQLAAQHESELRRLYEVNHAGI